MNPILELPDERATAALGAAIASALPGRVGGWVILLSGELGAGKSSLARALLRSLGHEGSVPSPTYTLVEPYDLVCGDVYHIDLYRISDPEELEFLGWSDLRDGLLLVEWPERVAGLAAEADLEIDLEYAGAGRRARLRGLSERGHRLAAASAAAFTDTVSS